jgi:hypothetical protein
MKVARTRLLEVFGTLEEFAKHARSPRLSYALAKNLAALRTEVEAIKKADTPSPEFLEYDHKRVEVCKLYSFKNPNEEPVIENNKFVIADQEALDRDIGVLRQTYSVTLEDRDKQAKELQKLLMEDVDVEFYPVKADLFLEEGALAPNAPNLVRLFSSLIGFVIVG